MSFTGRTLWLAKFSVVACSLTASSRGVVAALFQVQLGRRAQFVWRSPRNTSGEDRKCQEGNYHHTGTEQFHGMVDALSGKRVDGRGWSDVRCYRIIDYSPRTMAF
jgi:hypothetical protein